MVPDTRDATRGPRLRWARMAASHREVVVIGNVGSFCGNFLFERGARVVAITDHRGGVRNPNGLDIPALLPYALKNDGVAGFPGGEPMTNAELFAAPVGKEVADNAMQVLGGWGYCTEFTVERLLRDAKLLEIGGGTLEAHQKNLTKDLTAQVLGQS